MTKTRNLADLGGGFIQAGTGAVQRTVESKLQDVVSVKDFGAVGDGVADDTNAIRAAIAAIELKVNNYYPPYPIDPRDIQKAPTLYFPVGYYKVTDTILVRGPINMLGEGQTWAANPAIIIWAPKTIFKFEGTFWDNYIGLGVEIEKLRVGHYINIGDPSDPENYDPDFANTVNRIAAFEFPERSTTPGYSNGGVTGTLSSNSIYFKSCRYGSQSWGSFVTMDHGDDIVMEGCCIDACQGVALGVEKNASNIRVTNCDFFSSGGTKGSIYVGSGAAGGIVISNNHFNTNEGHPDPQIQIGSIADTTTPMSSVSITGNTFYNVAPIRLYSNVDGVQIANNVGNSLTGPLIDCLPSLGGLRTATNVQITDNNVKLKSLANPAASLINFDPQYKHTNFVITRNLVDSSIADAAGVPTVASDSPNYALYDYFGENKIIVPGGRLRYSDWLLVPQGTKPASERASFFSSALLNDVSQLDIEVCKVKSFAQGFIVLDIDFSAQVGILGGTEFSQAGFLSNKGQIMPHKLVSTNNAASAAALTSQFPTAISESTGANNVITPLFITTYDAPSGTTFVILRLTAPVSHNAFFANVSASVASCSNGYNSPILIAGY